MTGRDPRWFGLVLSVAVGAGCGDDILIANPELPPAEIPINGTITGRVCDDTLGIWVAGATAHTVIDDAMVSETTDAEGRFTFSDVPPGIYTVQVVAGTFQDAWQTTVEEGATAVVGPTTCDGRGAIRGRVCNETAGQWVAGATCTLDDASATTVQSNEFGWFEFRGLVAGDYVIQITSADYSGTRSAQVIPGQINDIGPQYCVGAQGGVDGRICGAEGYWLSGARVFVELADGSVVETTTDSDGRYTLTGLPDGTHTVQVTRGSFATSFEVTVSGGQIAIVPDPVCIPPTVQIAVVTGIYDSVQNVLTDLGMTIRRSYDLGGPTEQDAGGNVDIIDGTSDYWVEEFLTDPAWLGEYDIVFFNCGLNDDHIFNLEPVVDTAMTNLASFAQNGGSVYASDWASEVLRVAFPGRINFHGNDGYGIARVGKSDSNLSSTVVDVGLSQALGRTQLTLNLNLPQWVVLDPIGQQPADVHTLVTADVEACGDIFCFSDTTVADSPLVVHFTHSTGKVLFTSAHNESQTTQDLRDVLNYIVFEL